jgi:hypothetical protein
VCLQAGTYRGTDARAFAQGTNAPLGPVFPSGAARGGVQSFVVRYDPTGSALTTCSGVPCVVTLFTNLVDATTRGITATADGGFVVIGTSVLSSRAFTATGPVGSAVPDLVKPANSVVGPSGAQYVVKYSSQGVPLWIALMVVAEGEFTDIFSVTEQEGGDIVVTLGRARGAAVNRLQINDGLNQVTNVAASGVNAYVVSFDGTSGALLSRIPTILRSPLAPSAGVLAGVSALGSAGGVAVVGQSSGSGILTVQGNPVPAFVSLAPGSGVAVVLSRLNRQLNPAWATQINGPGDDVSGDVSSG